MNQERLIGTAKRLDKILKVVQIVNIVGGVLVIFGFLILNIAYLVNSENVNTSDIIKFSTGEFSLELATGAEMGIDLIKLPYITCHSLRHTFTNRMCEAGVNIKTMQGMLGHTSAVTTLNIYTDLTQRLELEGFEKLQNLISS